VPGRLRQVVVLSRQLESEPLPALRATASGTTELVMVAPAESYEYRELVTDTDWELMTLARL